MNRKPVIYLTLPLAALVIACSLVAIFTPDLYKKETLNWQVQSYGQDLVDLILVVPVLLFTAIAGRNSSRAFLVWGGAVFYLTYTFILYCFDVHFNSLFMIYCFALGLSFYSCLYFASQKDSFQMTDVPHRLRRVTGIYFLVIALIFYFLWISERLPAIFAGTIPASLEEAGLFTNGVQVLDLAIVLPGIFLTGILLLKKRKAGYYLAPVILVFFILMNLTIAGLMLLLHSRGENANLGVAAIMLLLALCSGVLLWRWLKSDVFFS